MAYQAVPTSGAQPVVAIVGHVHSFPRHPEPGTEVIPFAHGEITVNEFDFGARYALVSVEWAMKHTTVDLETGASHQEYRRGVMGHPQGTTWYLSPVTLENGTYRLEGGMARGFRDAELPPIPELDAPAVVPIHDHQLY